ncbi:LOW QUALITY PROTEIN: TRIO and F-actin-binding protein, partial [Galemys pyrenaicus]
IPGGEAWRRLCSRGEGLLAGGTPTWARRCLLSPTPSQEPGSPPSAEVLYCDLPCRPPASEHPLGPSTPGCQSVADPGLAPGPERWVELRGLGAASRVGRPHPAPLCHSRVVPGASAGHLKEHPTTAPTSRSWEPEAASYLEGLALALGGSLDQLPGSGTSSSPSPDGDTPDDTSNSSSADWDSVERWEEAPHCDLLTVMIPRKPQEGPRADGARKAPSVLARSPVGGDTTGQRKEDTSCGSRSPGQPWARLRGESGSFWERHQSALTQAASAAPQRTSLKPPLHSSTRPESPLPPKMPSGTGPRAWPPIRTLPGPLPHGRTPPEHLLPQESPKGTTPEPRPPNETLLNFLLLLEPSNKTTPEPLQPDRATLRLLFLHVLTNVTSPEHPVAHGTTPEPPSLTEPPNRKTPEHPVANGTTPEPPPPTEPPNRKPPEHPVANRTTPEPPPPTEPPNGKLPEHPVANGTTPEPPPPTEPPNRKTPEHPMANGTTPEPPPPTEPPKKTPEHALTNGTTPEPPPPTEPPKGKPPEHPVANGTTPEPPPPTEPPKGKPPKHPVANGTTPEPPPPTEPPNGKTPEHPISNGTTPEPPPPAELPNSIIPRLLNTRTSLTQRDKSKTSCTQWDKLRASCTQQDNTRPSSFRQDNPGASSAPYCAQQNTPRTSSPHRSTQRSSPRNASPHRTNKDIPWASFPLRPTQSDGPRTSSPSRSKQSEVPWAGIALRPTQGDRPQASSPTRAAQPSSGPPQQNSPSRTTSSSHNPGHQRVPRTASPLYPTLRGAPQSSSEPSQPPCAVCIGHRDAPRASSPPRYLQHDPFPFFPDPQASERESPHHDPPYMPPAVCIGHRDAPRASSPPRHTQFDPFPFLPDTSDAEDQPPQHEPPQFPPPVCIGYRDAPRASSPPRQAPEPSLLFQDLPRASTESLAPSTDSLHEPPHIPTPVCIGYRDAPYFSSPPRQVPEPSLFFQDPPGTSMESLAPSIDSLHGSTMLPPQVCIGHRDAPRASSPPRHPPSDLAFLASSPPPGSSRGSAPGEPRHTLEREEYTVLADLPPPRRLAHREPGPQGSSGGRTGSPGRAEVERLFGQERRGATASARRKAEAPGAFQARGEGRSQQPGQGQSQLLRRQSSPALSRELTKPLAKQAAPARHSQEDAPLSRSPERQPEGNQRLQGSLLPPRTSARTPERERRMEKPLERGHGGPKQSLGGWRSQEELPGSRGPHRCLERRGSSQEEGPGLGGWQGREAPIRGAATGLEGTWRALPKKSEENWGELSGSISHGGQSESWEEPPSNGLQVSPDRPAQRGWGSLQELSSPHQPRSPAESTKSQQPETTLAEDRGPEGAGPHLPGPKRHPELDWRDLVGLLWAPGEGARARMEGQTLASHLPRLYWEGLLELLQAQLPRKDPAGHWDGLATVSGPELDSPGTSAALEQEQHHQPEGWAQATRVNGHGPGPRPQSSAQPPSPACTSTQWPETEVMSRPKTSTLLGLDEKGLLGSGSPAGEPSSQEWKFQSEEPEESEPSRSQDSLTDQRLADSADKRPAEGKARSPLKGRLVCSWRMPGDRPTLFNPFLLSLGVDWQRPDLLNFKKGWMSILDEPGEWKKHWFVLTDSSLKYYRDSTAEEVRPGTADSGGHGTSGSRVTVGRFLFQADELDGEIDLRACTDVTEHAVQRNYGFQIHAVQRAWRGGGRWAGARDWTPSPEVLVPGDLSSEPVRLWGQHLAYLGEPRNHRGDLGIGAHPRLTKDAVYTLSAMTSGIRRNWIEALRKTVRPTSAPDVTKLSDCNKENALHGCGSQRGSLKMGEQRAGSEVIGQGPPRKADGQRPSLDYVELSPMTQCSPRARAPARTLDHPAKQEELERDLAQRSEERRKWFEAPETRAGEGPRRGLGAPLTEDQQSRLSEEIEKKWQELEKLPLRENKRVPLSALLNQSRGEHRGTPSESHEALEKEVQSLRAQLEACRLRGEAPQEAPRAQQDSHAPPGYISQEVCEHSLAEMESAHQQVMEELQRHYERELQRLQQEKEWLLAEETAATVSAIAAMKKAYQEELSQELSKTRSLQQGPDGLRKQHQSDMAALRRELQVLSEQYSQKCLEVRALTRQVEEREHSLRRCRQEDQELLRRNQELHAHLSEEIGRLRGPSASEGTGGGCGRSSERSSCELEVLLRVKEKELQYLKKEVQCLRDELQTMQKDQRFASRKYQDVYVELNHVKTQSEREIEELKEHLRLAMAALREQDALRNSLAE